MMPLFYKTGTYPQITADISLLLTEIANHYKVDTYARKLFLKTPYLATNQEYNRLIKYLTAYFLYEQLFIDIDLDVIHI